MVKTRVKAGCPTPYTHLGGWPRRIHFFDSKILPIARNIQVASRIEFLKEQTKGVRLARPVTTYVMYLLALDYALSKPSQP